MFICRVYLPVSECGVLVSDSICLLRASVSRIPSRVLKGRALADLVVGQLGPAVGGSVDRRLALAPRLGVTRQDSQGSPKEEQEFLLCFLTLLVCFRGGKTDLHVRKGAGPCVAHGNCSWSLSVPGLLHQSFICSLIQRRLQRLCEVFLQVASLP